VAKEALILYIDPKVKKKLRVIADEEDRSISAVARRIIEESVAEKKA
jgi:predicted transcriptional regulator